MIDVNLTVTVIVRLINILKKGFDMKETTKDRKAIAEFKQISELCKDSWVDLQDYEIEIACTHYTCNVIIEDNECVIYKDFGGLNKYKVDAFNLS